MSVFKKISCDGPRCTKESSNHVYQIIDSKVDPKLFKGNNGMNITILYIETKDVDENAFHFCGTECVLRFISEKLEFMHQEHTNGH